MFVRADQRVRPKQTLDDYNAMAETAYLLSTENNMKHLLASIDQVKTGHAFKKDKCPDQRDFEATFQR
jgi:hypothetical protein